MFATNKIYVGNLPLNLSRAALLEHFLEHAGLISNINLGIDREGNFGGYCYFTLTAEADLIDFCNRYNKSVFSERPLRVHQAPARRQHLHGHDITHEHRSIAIPA